MAAAPKLRKWMPRRSGSLLGFVDIELASGFDHKQLAADGRQERFMGCHARGASARPRGQPAEGNGRRAPL